MNEWHQAFDSSNAQTSLIERFREGWDVRELHLEADDDQLKSRDLLCKWCIFA